MRVRSGGGGGCGARAVTAVTSSQKSSDYELVVPGRLSKDSLPVNALIIAKSCLL